jgi:lipoprotein-anchoring transpeptidase ErfK/SrfK
MEEAMPIRELESGFSVAIVEESQRGGLVWGRTKRGEWLLISELVPARESKFRGVPVVDRNMAFGWIAVDTAMVYSASNGTGRSKRLLHHFELVPIYEESNVKKSSGTLRISSDKEPAQEWVLAKNVVRPRVSRPPFTLDERSSKEKWIDVDASTQTLVAYEGEVPIFATLVSTGKGASGTDSATPLGIFRIWAKLISSRMTNVDKGDDEPAYWLDDVPHVQFFDRGYGIHGAFWHGQFGKRRSHGCVNVSLADAEWLFNFSGPRMPAGWNAILPTSDDPGTLIRIR